MRDRGAGRRRRVSKTERPLPEAERIAAASVADLAPSCARIQVAGLVRRRKEVVGAYPCCARLGSIACDERAAVDEG
jgi:hypothetical protein